MDPNGFSRTALLILSYTAMQTTVCTRLLILRMVVVSQASGGGPRALLCHLAAVFSCLEGSIELPDCGPYSTHSAVGPIHHQVDVRYAAAGFRLCSKVKMSLMSFIVAVDFWRILNVDLQTSR